HVFGLVDRDFGYSNHPRWPDSTASPVFVPEVHEVENYLLEPDHLAGCDLNNGGRAAAEIRNRLHTTASQMGWGMACCQVLGDLRAALVQNFPAHAMVRSLAEAEQLIGQSAWFQNFPAFAGTLHSAGEVTRRLTAAHGIFDAALGSGQWQQQFSGKAL